MSNLINVSELRQNYNLAELLEENIFQNPFEQFGLWLNEALASKILEPNAMFLSTISNGKPVGRIVLLKGFDTNGFVFYTNYRSHKGYEIEQNPFASITFFWDLLERQVRIEGEVEKVSDDESNDYFWSRPRGSQIGAWVSSQSEVIENRGLLEEKLKFFEDKFQNLEIIPRPPHWGGYRVIPQKIEFWQGRSNRLHDRILYSKSEGETWQISRLQP